MGQPLRMTCDWLGSPTWVRTVNLRNTSPSCYQLNYPDPNLVWLERGQSPFFIGGGGGTKSVLLLGLIFVVVVVVGLAVRHGLSLPYRIKQVQCRQACVVFLMTGLCYDNEVYITWSLIRQVSQRTWPVDSVQLADILIGSVDIN